MACRGGADKGKEGKEGGMERGKVRGREREEGGEEGRKEGLFSEKRGLEAFLWDLAREASFTPCLLGTPVVLVEI